MELQKLDRQIRIAVMLRTGFAFVLLFVLSHMGCSSTPESNKNVACSEAKPSSENSLVICDFKDGEGLENWTFSKSVTLRTSSDSAEHAKRSLRVTIPAAHATLDKRAGFEYSGKWDLSDYTDLVIRIRNNSKFYTLIKVRLADSEGGKGWCNMFLMPGVTREFEWDITRLGSGIELGDINKIRFSRRRNVPDAVDLSIDYIGAVTRDGKSTRKQKLLVKIADLKSELDSIDTSIFIENPSYKRIADGIDSLTTLLTDSQKSGGIRLQPLVDEFESLRDEVRLLAHVNDTGVLVWQVNPWEEIAPGQMPDNNTKETSVIDVSVAGNEYEDVTLMLSNLDPDTKTIQLKLSGPGAEMISSLKYADFVVAPGDGSLSADLLRPAVFDSGMYALTLSPHMSRQLWIRIDTKKERQMYAPGQQSVVLDILEDQKTIKSVSIIINKWDFLLPDESTDVVTWHYLLPDISDYYPAIATYPYRYEAIKNMADYGCHVQTIHAIQMPWPVLDDDKQIIGLDTTHFDEPIKVISKDPKAKYLFLLGFGREPFRGLNNGLEYMSGEWKRVFKEWTSVHIVNYMTERGIEKSRYEFRSADEPYKEQLYEEARIARVLKEGDPELQFSVNPIVITADIETAVAPWVDTFQLPLMIIVQWNPYIVDVLKATGKKVTCYACRGGFRDHDALLYDYYRLQAWKMNKYGLEGMGCWVYYRDGTPVYDLVYVDGGILMSRCMEAYREGIEDNKYLNLLRSKIKELGVAGSQASLIAEAEQLIEDAIEDVTAKFDDPARVYVWRELIAEEIEKINDELD